MVWLPFGREVLLPLSFHVSPFQDGMGWPQIHMSIPRHTVVTDEIVRRSRQYAAILPWCRCVV